MLYASRPSGSLQGTPHPEWGEEVGVCRLPAGSRSNARSIDVLCLDQIARFKRPKDYRFVPTLPKSDNGKVLKSELRKILQQESHGA